MYLKKAAQSRSNRMNKLLNMSSYQTKTYDLLKLKPKKPEKSVDCVKKKQKDESRQYQSNKENLGSNKAIFVPSSLDTKTPTMLS